MQNDVDTRVVHSDCEFMSNTTLTTVICDQEAEPETALHAERI
jgi:hypothetical protein